MQATEALIKREGKTSDQCFGMEFTITKRSKAEAEGIST
jgi:hypothetical protein